MLLTKASTFELFFQLKITKELKQLQKTRKLNNHSWQYSTLLWI